MILKRWDETKALREAFDQLIDRMQAVVETTLQKVSIEASQRGLESGFDPKQPSIWFWKNEWATRKGDPGVYFFVSDFVPADYGKAIGDYPSAVGANGGPLKAADAREWRRLRPDSPVTSAAGPSEHVEPRGS